MKIGRFLTPLRVEVEVGNDEIPRLELLEDFGFLRPSGEEDWTPRGFLFDGASVPRIFWRIEPPVGCIIKGAVPHDRRYKNQEGTREEADRVLLEAMVAAGVSPLKRSLVYRAVRIGGVRGWGS